MPSLIPEPEEQPTVSLGKENVVRLREAQLSDGKDLEKALEAAEFMLAAAEERHRHEQNRTFTIWSFIIAVIVTLVASLFAIHSFYALTYAVLPLTLSASVLAALFALLRRQLQRGEFDLRLRLATRLAAMINETYLEVAEREQWSYLRREATKIRLSAFPLEPNRSSLGSELSKTGHRYRHDRRPRTELAQRKVKK
ncbi:hypothetical protein [Mycobacterium sp. 1245852.3]|uniref:hypothetical protein n=1 Tax=Mycobacterium sp. 1245852.3 TaxID=1856860 RepID=UPI000801FC9D|nr:hypothetical protein [Mycobacterium sp. 1245852.3]OBK03150.1 hypothetical protein A9W96_15945 [Mycobacterium sp. 1245852.3]